MLERYRDYAQSNPLPSWLIEVTFLLTVSLTGFWVVPGPKKVGLLLLLVVFALSLPTRGLIQRFSEEQRRVKPVPPRQEEGVGLLSLSALGASFGALGVVIFGKHLGLFLPPNKSLLLLLFSVSTLLSLALGYAARRTPEGLWGLRLSAMWLILLVGAACVVLLLHHT